MKYLIEIQETLARIVAVEAQSSEEALVKVTAAYWDEKIVLDSGDYAGKTIEDVTGNYECVDDDAFPRLEDYD